MPAKTVVLILAGIIGIRLLLAAFLPFGQTSRFHLEGLNDEPAHYNYIRHVAEQRTFPVLTTWVLDDDAFVINEFEYHQAPLYYLACVPLYWLFGEKGAVFPCRLMSFLFGICTLGVLVLLLKDLGCPPPVRLGTLLFSGFLFSHAYFSSLVSNDSLSWLLALVLAREIIRIGRLYHAEDVRSTTRAIAGITAVMAAGLLTKSSFLMFLPIVAACFIYLSFAAKSARPLLHGGLVVLLSSLAALPWYLRNLHLYHSITGMPAPSAMVPLSAESVIACVKGMIKFFWYPMQNLEGGTVAFAALTMCGAVMLFLFGIAALVWGAKKANWTFATILLAVILLSNGAAAIWYYLQWQNPEARFLFPALGSIVFFVVVPAYNVFLQWRLDRFFIPCLWLCGLFPYTFLIVAR